MAKIEELVRQISDVKLRDEIATEIKELKKQKRFGLVFEEHLPEMLRLPKAKIRLGNLVAHRDAPGSEVWRVIGINGKKAKCRQPVTPGKYDQEIIKEFPLEELVIVVSFGEPIYPILTPINRVERGGPNKPWHVLINADNYHALQLLLYSHERKVDLIYIDPPYNTGARDWKYNNDYVDKTDAWRHSKWLSMMKKRLALAKRLLKQDGVLIIAIDDNEARYLQTLLEGVAPDFEITSITVVHNPRGNITNNFARTHEYALFLIPRNKSLIARTAKENVSPRKLRRWGHNSTRKARPTMFYAIYVRDGLPTRVGEPPESSFHPTGKNVQLESGEVEVWPIDQNGIERRWNFGLDAIEDEFDRIIALNDENGSIDLFLSEEETVPKTVWAEKRFEAGKYGASLVKEIVQRPFPYPKSVYTIQQCLDLVLRSKTNAVVLDFFAGSGTTLHATLLLNLEHPGNRQCILVTNNEVEESQSKKLRKANLHPGDDEYESEGICESITWPRCKYVIQGHRDDGTSLSGQYLSGRPLKDGFDENMEYFRVDFLDPSEVERGDAFEGVLPILWLMAGAIGERESRRGTTPWYIAKQSPFAVLIQETKFRDFQKEVRERKDLTTIFLITDSDDNFGSMRRELGRRHHCVQLYKSYLENFRINTVDRYAAGHDEESE